MRLFLNLHQSDGIVLFGLKLKSCKPHLLFPYCATGEQLGDGIHLCCPDRILVIV